VQSSITWIGRQQGPPSRPAHLSGCGGLDRLPGLHLAAKAVDVPLTEAALLPAQQHAAALAQDGQLEGGGARRTERRDWARAFATLNANILFEWRPPPSGPG
jgi:hypothetical protein